jgi:hypothetical protein
VVLHAHDTPDRRRRQAVEVEASSPITHVVPVLLGGGVRLFDRFDLAGLEVARVVDSPSVTHIRYRVVR